MNTPAPTHFFDAHLKRMILHATAQWRRRNTSILNSGCSTGVVTHSLWESGFTVHTIESNPTILQTVRSTFPKNCCFYLGQPGLLAFEDNEFDYAVCLSHNITGTDKNAHKQEFRARIEECLRVARRGVLIGFYNCYSTHYIKNLFSKPFFSNSPVSNSRFSHLRRIHSYAPHTLYSWCKSFESRTKASFLGSYPLYLPHSAPKTPQNKVLNKISTFIHQCNHSMFPLPFGAVTLLRIEFSPPKAVTPLLLDLRKKYQFSKNTATTPCGYSSQQKNNAQ